MEFSRLAIRKRQFSCVKRQSDSHFLKYYFRNDTILKEFHSKCRGYCVRELRVGVFNNGIIRIFPRVVTVICQLVSADFPAITFVFITRQFRGMNSQMSHGVALEQFLSIRGDHR